MTPHRLVISALTLLWFSATALAEQASLPRYGVVGEDDRKVIANGAPPWSAIGHVNIGGRRMRWICSGTLVAPRVVLTAAHCVVNFPKRKLHPMRDINFVAGVNKGKSKGAAKAKCVKLLKDTVGYDYIAAIGGQQSAERQSPQQIVRDLAVIVLNKDLAKAGTIGIASNRIVPVQSPVAHASFPGTRRQVLTGQKNCRTLVSAVGLLVTDCDVEPGSSGGPILVEEDGQYRLAGVAVGYLENLGTLAVPAASIPRNFLTADCP
ncbi:MAG: trypsin-like serine protease [Rhizobiales bacterium]|nr:trypsin-like serine protease [Hyphomicrobiales bacterium]